MLNSPLTATVGVLAGLGLLAIPLRQLTTAPPAPPSALTAAPAGTETAALLRLKLLTPAALVRLKTEDGRVVLELTDVPAGESEHDTTLPIHQGRLDLMLEAELDASTTDTAVFLTVMPDARQEQTRYLIGTGIVAEPLTFDWQSEEEVKR
jgi:hypothetical protein